MALAFDDRKLLPPGVHDATLKEVDKQFARFQKSDRRPQLFAKLRDYLAAVKKAGCGSAVILNGSFVMACVDEPEDIDLILVLPEDWDESAALKPYQYNLVSKRRVRQEYAFDVAVVALALSRNATGRGSLAGLTSSGVNDLAGPKKQKRES